MDYTYWQKQSSEPLFSDILWSRPESKAGAGKLLIIGGHEQAFSAPGLAFNAAQSAGAGVIRVLLPEAIRKIVKHVLPEADYAPSTPSGSFSRSSLSEMLALASWSDTVLLAGDFGRNSETAIVLESFVEKYNGPLIITQDAIEYFRETPLNIVDRDETILVLSLSQLQKLFMHTPTITPITLGMTTLQLVEALHNYTREHPASIVTLHSELLFVASGGNVTTTALRKDIWRVEFASIASVYYMQNLRNTTEVITTAAYEYAKNTMQI